MTSPRQWRNLPLALRLAVSGIAAGGLGGTCLIGLVLVMDVAHLRSLLTMAAATLSPTEWLALPGVFAALGLAVAWTMPHQD